MPNKFTSSVLVIIIFLAVLAGLAYYWFVYRTPQVAAPSFNVEEQKITKEEKPLKFDIAYPHISSADEFNKNADDFITQQMADFSKNSLDNDAAVKAVDPESYAKYPRTYDMVVTYATGELDASVLSAVLETYQFTGGAHGNTTFYSINYSPKDKKEIKLADLFENQPDYVQKISDFCEQDLTKQITEKMESTEGSWIDQGAGPKEENFSTFLINKDSIVFYFPQYQVAPGAAGSFKVTMPR